MFVSVFFFLLNFNEAFCNSIGCFKSDCRALDNKFFSLASKLISKFSWVFGLLFFLFRLLPFEVFGNNIPKISSTKSLTGHSLGATGVHEAIYSLLMMNNNFLSGSANINSLDDKAKDHNIILKTEQNDKIENILSNSFGFGGTNATLLISRYNND